MGGLSLGGEDDDGGSEFTRIISNRIRSGKSCLYTLLFTDCVCVTASLDSDALGRRPDLDLNAFLLTLTTWLMELSLKP